MKKSVLTAMANASPPPLPPPPSKVSRKTLIATIVIAVVVVAAVVGAYLLMRGTTNPSPSITTPPSPRTTATPSPSSIAPPSPRTTATPSSGTSSPSQTNAVDNNATPNRSVEQVRDIAMAYIKAHHNETAQYMQSFSWTGGNITPEGLVGGQWYSYQSAGWNITIQYPVALPPGAITIYSVTATYTSQVTPGEISVSWQGTLQNGIITETAYTFNP